MTKGSKGHGSFPAHLIRTVHMFTKSVEHTTEPTLLKNIFLPHDTIAKKKGLGPKEADRNTKFWLKETETKLLEAFTTIKPYAKTFLNRKIDTYTTLLSLATPDCANACETCSSSHDE